MERNAIKKSPFQRAKMTLGVIALVLIVGCSKVEVNPESMQRTGDENAIEIVTTTGMISDVVQKIGGEEVNVTGLMRPGVDPHLYKASQGDMSRLEQAEIIFYNGLHLEGKMTEIFEKLEKRKPTVAVTRNLDPESLRSGQDIQGTEYDPHVWFDVRNWISAAETVRETLIEYDPDHADLYRQNAEAYISQLNDLDEEVRAQIATIPEQGRVLVTAHDAFGYYGNAYNIKVMGLQGISTAAEYGSKDVAKLRDYLVENKIKAVFVESSIPTKSMEAVIAGAAEIGHQVVIGGELYSDSMGEPGSDADTYIKMVRHNTTTIVEALK